MARAGASGHLDAADLGLAADDEACRRIAEVLGMSPPWPLTSLKAMFDAEYPGWDDPPSLPVASPVARLCGLMEVLRGAADGAHEIPEVLQSLALEVKHAQIRVMCPRAEDTGQLQDECQFLLLALGQLGGLVCGEREAGARERAEAVQRLAEAREDACSARQAAHADALEARRLQGQLEELTAEADALQAQQRRGEELQREVLLLQDQAAEEQERGEELRRAAEGLRRELEQTHDELRQAKAQRAALAIAHEESEGAVDALQRRLDATLAGGGGRAAPAAGSRDDGPLAPAAASARCAAGTQTQASAAGAGAAPPWTPPRGESGRLRPSFLAWRCARLEGLRARAGAEASAGGGAGGSLEADLGGSAVCAGIGARCCCRGPALSCCRTPWLEATLKLLQEQRRRADLAKSSAADAALRARRSQCLLALLLLASAALALEPHLGNGPLLWSL